MTEASDQRPKVLVVDDSKVMRLSAGKILSPEFELLLAEDGQEAWEILRQDPEILAVFSDVGMPRLDGYELLAQIRQASDERLRSLPVIIVTGNEEDDARANALERGATDFITKPFDRSQLLARARAHASHDQMRRRFQELEASNTRDAVTQVGNKRYFEAQLKSLRASSLRHHRPMALLRLDLLDFEDIMNSRGKRLASSLLREVAHLLKLDLREEDEVARLGGGRFAVICPDCDREGAEALIGRVMAKLIEHDFCDEHQISLELAAGVYLPGNEAKLTLSEIYAQAQKAVTQASTEGSGATVILPEVGPSREELQEERLVERLERLLSSYPPTLAQRAFKRLLEKGWGKS